MADKRAHELAAMAAADAATAGNLAIVGTSAGLLKSARFDVLMGALGRLQGVHLVTDPKYAATGDGSTDDTTAIHLARDGASTNGTLVFPPGTYITSGLTASVAGQRWYLMRGATLKMKSATNATVISVTGDDVQILGPGTIDGNRTNQSSGSPRGVHVQDGADRCVIGEGLTIQNCRDMGIWVGLTAAQTIAGLTVRSCTLSGNGPATANQSQIYIQVDGGTLTDLTLVDIDADGTPNDNGGIKIATVNSGVIRRVQFDRVRIKVGDAGATDTLGFEFFAATGALIQGITGGVVSITGENSTNTKCFGFSLGGTATIADTTGIRDVAIAAIRVKDCRSTAVEVIACNVAIGEIACSGSGRLSLDGSEVVGGATDITIGNYVNDSCVDTGEALLIGVGTTNSMSRIVIHSVSLKSPAGSAIVIGTSSATIPVSHLYIGRVIAKGIGAGILAAGVSVQTALTDSEIGPVDLDLTGSGALSDGIILNNTSIARVKFIRPRIKGAARHGIFANVAVTDVEVRGAYVSSCGSDGIRTTGGTGWILEDNECVSNTGTGIILGSSPALKSMRNNRASSNTTAQINKGSATFQSTPRGNQSTTGVASGRAVLVAGTVTVNTAEVLASDNILLSRVLTGGTQGTLSVGTIVAGTSFVINSSNAADTSTIFWEIVH